MERARFCTSNGCATLDAHTRLSTASDFLWAGVDRLVSTVAFGVRRHRLASSPACEYAQAGIPLSVRYRKSNKRAKCIRWESELMDYLDLEIVRLRAAATANRSTQAVGGGIRI
ncbi:MAG: hypothetical protein WDN30_04810 [Pararobbsia sp.]